EFGGESVAVQERRVLCGGVALGFDLDQPDAASLALDDVRADEEIARAERRLEKDDVSAVEQPPRLLDRAQRVALADLDSAGEVALRELAHLEPALGENFEEIVLPLRVEVLGLAGEIELRRTLERPGEPGLREEADGRHRSLTQTTIEGNGATSAR